MARILIVGGGCRGLGLTRELVAGGHAVRVTTRGEYGRAAIEAAGAECWIGDPDRIASLRLALDGVTVVCWLLATATGEPEQVRALHSSRLRFMLGQMVDTTVRGLVYESAGAAGAEVLEAGAGLVQEQCRRNAIPLRLLDVDPRDLDAWQAQAAGAIAVLIESPSSVSPIG